MRACIAKLLRSLSLPKLNLLKLLWLNDKIKLTIFSRLRISSFWLVCLFALFVFPPNLSFFQHNCCYCLEMDFLLWAFRIPTLEPNTVFLRQSQILHFWQPVLRIQMGMVSKTNRYTIESKGMCLSITILFAYGLKKFPFRIFCVWWNNPPALCWRISFLFCTGHRSQTME